MIEIGSKIGDRYVILEEIGRGGMSTVYLARDQRLDRYLVVKEVCFSEEPDYKAETSKIAVYNEVKLIKRLNHPAFPEVYDFIDETDRIFMMLEYVEGQSLQRVLNNMGVQSEGCVIAWAKQLCDALYYLHTRGKPIIYRDIKPDNIMINTEGMLKILDFGTAVEYTGQNDELILGTKGYASPEQYYGKTDPRTDIFALGMTMHHLLTGIDPRKEDVYHSVRQYNSNLSKELEWIIDRCVEPDPDQRYQNCKELEYDLDNLDVVSKRIKKQKEWPGIFLSSAKNIFR